MIPTLVKFLYTCLLTSFENNNRCPKSFIAMATLIAEEILEIIRLFLADKCSFLEPEILPK